MHYSESLFFNPRLTYIHSRQPNNRVLKKYITDMNNESFVDYHVEMKMCNFAGIPLKEDWLLAKYPFNLIVFSLRKSSVVRSPCIKYGCDAISHKY